MKDDIETIEEALKEAAEVLSLCDPEMKRAHNIKDEPFDSLIKNICEERGYGATIDSAVRQWQLKDPQGSFTSGPCVGTVVSTIKTLKKALEALEHLKPHEGQGYKWGEAYEIFGDVYWYIGQDPTHPSACIFACDNFVYESWEKSLDKAKRVPEKDLTRPPAEDVDVTDVHKLVFGELKEEIALGEDQRDCVELGINRTFKHYHLTPKSSSEKEER